MQARPWLFSGALFVATLAIASVLRPGLSAASPDTGTTIRVSVASDGTQQNLDAYPPISMSGDGRYVLFTTKSANLVPGDTNGYDDIFLHDCLTGQTTRISVGPGGVQANGGSTGPSVSGDGRYVAFASGANNLVAGDTNNASDLFVLDRQTGELSRVSVSSGGAQANGGSWGAAVSPTGRYVAFNSLANNLVPGDTNGRDDAFVHDRVTHTTVRISIASDGTQSNAYPPGGQAVVSNNGIAAFSSWATTLVSGDTNNAEDVFVRDLAAGITARISVSSAGVQGNGESWSPKVSDDGRYVSFVSIAYNLVDNDTNWRRDVFAHDRLREGPTSTPTYTPSMTPTPSVTPTPSITPTPTVTLTPSPTRTPGTPNAVPVTRVGARGASAAPVNPWPALVAAGVLLAAALLAARRHGRP